MANKELNNVKITSAFTEASTRENIQSGETLGTLFGKIKKHFSDLKAVAFSGSYSDLSNKPSIPTSLASLSSDSTHRTVTDSEKSAWNLIKEFSKKVYFLGSNNTLQKISTSSNLTDSQVITIGDSNTLSYPYSVYMIGKRNVTDSATSLMCFGSGNTLTDVSSLFVAGDFNTVTKAGYFDQNYIIGYSNTSDLSDEARVSNCFAIGNRNTISGISNIVLGSNNKLISENDNYSWTPGHPAYCAILGGVNNTIKGYTYSSPNGTSASNTCYSNIIGGKDNLVDYSGDLVTLVNGLGLQEGGAHIGGRDTPLVVMGKYNCKAFWGTGDNPAFVIGGGTGDEYSLRKNIFKINYEGNVYASGTFTANSADYAEYFEWEDGNKDNDERLGVFVTINNEGKISIANSSSEYILGITSALPSVLGNSAEMQWNEKYLKDEFGREIFEEYEEVIKSENENEEDTIVIKTRNVLNPNYDEELEYVPRSQRKEWTAIGMLGVLTVYDNGSCKDSAYCKPGNNGYAIPATISDMNSYKIVGRVNDNLIKVIVK